MSWLHVHEGHRDAMRKLALSWAWDITAFSIPMRVSPDPDAPLQGCFRSINLQDRNFVSGPYGCVRSKTINAAAPIQSPQAVLNYRGFPVRISEFSGAISHGTSYRVLRKGHPR
jgi:hypothetical protein